MNILKNLFSFEKDRKHLIIEICGLKLKIKIKNDYDKQQFFSAANQNFIQAVRNHYQGERLFIIGGSPSLSELDLSLLNNEHTMTVGRGYKLKNQGLEHASFHVFSDYKGYLESVKEIDTSFADTYFIAAQIPCTLKIKNKIFFQIADNNENYHFIENLNLPLQTCQTVIGFALSCAAHLGFSEIIIIGVDLDFSKCAGHAYQESKGETERQKSHSLSNQEIMYKGLKTATEYLQNHDIKVLNASPAGKLDFIPRVKYNNLFH